jgi:hypothetical protein
MKENNVKCSFFELRGKALDFIANEIRQTENRQSPRFHCKVLYSIETWDRQANYYLSTATKLISNKLHLLNIFGHKA